MKRIILCILSVILLISFSFNLNSQTNSKKKHSTTIASKKHDKKVIKKKVAKNTSYKNKHKKV
jgi:hypothetical protein